MCGMSMLQPLPADPVGVHGHVVSGAAAADAETCPRPDAGVVPAGVWISMRKRRRRRMETCDSWGREWHMAVVGNLGACWLCKVYVFWTPVVGEVVHRCSRGNVACSM